MLSRSEADIVETSQQEHRMEQMVRSSPTRALFGTTDLRKWSNVDRPSIGKFGSGSEHMNSPLYQTIST
jgi:hypothetical protein